MAHIFGWETYTWWNGVRILLKLELAKFPGNPVTSHIVSVVFQQYLHILHYILPISSSRPVIILYGDSEFSKRQNTEFLMQSGKQAPPECWYLSINVV